MRFKAIPQNSYQDVREFLVNAKSEQKGKTGSHVHFTEDYFSSEHCFSFNIKKNLYREGKSHLPNPIKLSNRSDQSKWRIALPFFPNIQGREKNL